MTRSKTGRRSALVVGVLAAAAMGVAARERPPMPKITQPVLFDTPEADAILAALQVFPPDNPWNQDISKLPVHKDSARMIASIGAAKSLGYNLDMGFVIVPPEQKKIPVKITEYPAESDHGPFPLPDNAPIENWPLQRNEDLKALPKAGQTLEDLQRHGTGDRHVILVDPMNGLLHEFWQARRTAGDGKPRRRPLQPAHGWLAPERWTSSDAAGLPVSLRSCATTSATGMVEHAMRSRCGRRGARTSCPPPTGRARTRERAAASWASGSACAGLRRQRFPKHAQAVLKGSKNTPCSWPTTQRLAMSIAPIAA